MRVPRVPSLRSVRFLPLVFLTGIDGFAMFAPYVIGVLTVGYAARMLRGRRGDADAQAEPTLALPL
jgi:hypothetical protein